LRDRGHDRPEWLAEIDRVAVTPSGCGPLIRCGFRRVALGQWGILRTDNRQHLPLQERRLFLGDLPDNRPVDPEVLVDRQRSRRHRAAGLDQMVADAEDAGLYELPSDVPFERLPIEGGE
jgi:hypothetical protein